MVESGYFEVVARPQELAPAERLVMAGRAMGILVIPRNFLAEARRDRGARVQLLLDGTDANSANIAMNYFELFVRELAGPLPARRSSCGRGCSTTRSWRVSTSLSPGWRRSS